MGDQMRPIDLAALLAILAAVILIMAASTPARPLSPLPGPLSVDDATTFFLDSPVVVSGYLVREGSRNFLCDTPSCLGTRLALVGLPPSEQERRVLVAGVITGLELAPLRLAGTKRTARF